MPQTNVEKGQAERGVAKLLKWLDSEETVGNAAIERSRRPRPPHHPSAQVMWDDDDVHIWRYREYSILR